MAKIKSWYKVVTPREDLRDGKPLDASEFAVHLDKVRSGNAHPDYQSPARFFERTYLTKNLQSLASEVIRRLSGEKTETSAVFNMATQFGGGKTHSMTLLYHLASQGPEARDFQGVPLLLERAGVPTVPKAAIAVFVGTEFDSIHGRGGDGDGTPKRVTPWGEIAYQLAGDAGLAEVAEHERQMIAPSCEVIRKFIPKDRPTLILVDELMNYVSRNRKSGLATQLYHFIQNLSEEARNSDRVVLVASIPGSVLEMTAEDEADYTRFKKLLNRLGKAIMMASDSETSEIIRRRLFEWDPRAVTQDGRIMLCDDAVAACKEYASWVNDHRQQFPAWFANNAQSHFETTYPFHPMVLSVFERKWQSLPRFQQTRGVLRLLALWVSNAYKQGFSAAQKDTLITLGTAPLDDSQFRAAVFEQLGESKLEGAITTDICGNSESHAVRLDQEAEESLRKAHIHKKVATVVFFESNGGQSKHTATVPEIRLGVSDPDLDLGNVETALETLTNSCYYLNVERNQYKFSLQENLNKRFADRRANVKNDEVEKLVREEIQKVFSPTDGIALVFFPEKSSQIPDRAMINFVIMSPEHALDEDTAINQLIESMTREYGNTGRRYKSALIWIVPDSATTLRDDARRLIAWQDIDAEGLKLDDAQARQLEENIRKAKRDLKESVWRSYKNVLTLARDNTVRTVDLGLVTSSSAETVCKMILSNLRQSGDIDKEVGPRFLVRNWPPAFTEWSTQSVRDAFFASPQFPRLLYGDSIKDTIARGVAEGHLAYVCKSADGNYSPFLYKKQINPIDVEVSEDTFIITSEEAERHIKPPELTSLSIIPDEARVMPGKKQTFTIRGHDQFGRDIEVSAPYWSATGGNIGSDGVFQAAADEGSFLVTVKTGKISASATVRIGKTDIPPPPPPPPPTNPKKLRWSGEVPPQKWMNLYTKVLTRYVKSGSLKLTVSLEATSAEGMPPEQVEETKSALRELGLNDDVQLN